tara:strand:+ start:85 stop:558 length:474 start_codon:yes stop_codon:yes gene_type:complete
VVKITKWKRLRKRKERIRAEKTLTSKTEEIKLAEPENISKKTQHSMEVEKPESTQTFKPNVILSQIPRYAYVLAIFALLAGVFFPLITPAVSFDFVIQGTAVLFLGLFGGILLFKAITSENRRGIFIAIGFALIAISLALIFLIGESARIFFNTGLL